MVFNQNAPAWLYHGEHHGTGVGLYHALHGDGQDSPKAGGES